MPHFRVRVTKDHLRFCSGHFITFAGNQVERVHGHNYQVAVEVAGPLDENHYVFDFVALRRIMRGLCEELDHRMMLPSQSKLIAVESKAAQVEVKCAGKFWSFPAEDCVLLPVENTTAEMLAKYLAQRLRKALNTECGYQPEMLTIEVEESPGQSAIYTE